LSLKHCREDLADLTWISFCCKDRIGYLLTRPVGRPPYHVCRFHANFSYQAGTWTKPRRVITKVERHPGELYPRVGFIVTNMSRPAERVIAFHNKRGTCEQWIKEGKGAIDATSCRTFAANAARFQLHPLACNLGNFLRTLATPEPIKDRLLTSLKDKLIKIGAKVVSYGRYVIFQMAEVAIAWMFQEFCDLPRNCGCCRRRHRQRRPIFMHQRQPTGGVRPNATQNGQTDPRTPCRSLLCRKSPLSRVGTSRQSRKSLQFPHFRVHPGNPGQYDFHDPDGLNPWEDEYLRPHV
jgi:hypothetical protein